MGFGVFVLAAMNYQLSAVGSQQLHEDWRGLPDPMGGAVQLMEVIEERQ